jgi:hypothetical protein
MAPGGAGTTWVAIAAAGAVVDDHRLRPAFAQALRDEARDVVGGAAGDEWDEQIDLLLRIVLFRQILCRDRRRRDHRNPESRHEGVGAHARFL